MSEEIAREILSLETLMPSEYEDKPLRKSVFRGDMAEKAPDLARAYLELLEENERLRDHLEQALRQWSGFSNDVRAVETAQPIEHAGDSEARLYRDSVNVLSGQQEGE